MFVIKKCSIICVHISETFRIFVSNQLKIVRRISVLNIPRKFLDTLNTTLKVFNLLTPFLMRVLRETLIVRVSTQILWGARLCYPCMYRR